jgi:hypothetical protein
MANTPRSYVAMKNKTKEPFGPSRNIEGKPHALIYGRRERGGGGSCVSIKVIVHALGQRFDAKRFCKKVLVRQSRECL